MRHFTLSALTCGALVYRLSLAHAQQPEPSPAPEAAPPAAEAPAAPADPSASPYVLYPATTWRHKNHVTLIEAMAIGLPIACSDRGPMPEVLRDGGVYFDPEDAESIARAIEALIRDPGLRMSVAKRAKGLSGQYSWARCAAETWSFLKAVSDSR